MSILLFFNKKKKPTKATPHHLFCPKCEKDFMKYNVLCYSCQEVRQIKITVITAIISFISGIIVTLQALDSFSKINPY